MPSDKTVRVGAFVFALFFAFVVALGYMPGINGQPHVHHPGMSMEPGEHMLMGLYRISAILFLVAALHSARASRLALTAFGWYYAYDATIYLVTGVLQQKPLGENIGLNIPHVIISSIMLWLAYRGRSNVASTAATVTA